MSASATTPLTLSDLSNYGPDIRLPLCLDFSPNDQLINKPLIVKIAEPKQVRSAGLPLILAIQQHCMIDVQTCALLEVPQLPADECAFIDGITHLAAATGGAPVFLDLPDQNGVQKRGDGPVQIARCNVQLVLGKPHASGLGVRVHAEPVLLTNG